MYTPNKTFVNFIDLTKRKLNTKKIVDVFDYNFSIGIKFNVYVDNTGSYSTNFYGNNFWQVLGHIEYQRFTSIKK